MKVNAHKLVSKHVKKISGVLLTVMLSELLIPLKALALTSGPSQPEFQGFTPLATTSLVDPFSGDFSYNIPLLEIDGYPLNLVYRATSNMEEEASWVGYGWNVNVGTLNRMVRGLPDDMDGEEIKSYQNVRERGVKSECLSVEPSISFNAGLGGGIGVSAGIQANIGYTEDDDDYTGKAVGVAVGAGVYAGVNAGPFSVSGNAGVTLAANSASGGAISTYAGFNATLTDPKLNYFSMGLGMSVNRTFNTISGWQYPSIVGSFNMTNVTMEVQKNFVNSINNDIPQITNPYIYTSTGKGYKFKLGVELGLLEGLGIDLGIGITSTHGTAKTVYDKAKKHKGYGYMYAEKASPTDILDFTRDNDGGLNKDMPFMPPAMKTFDVFSSTAHNASSTFRADRNDFGVVRDPRVEFKNSDMHNQMHEMAIKAHFSLTCPVGISGEYNNIKTSTEGFVASGGCADDMVPYRSTTGRSPNLFFKACGATAMVDDNYLNQVNGSGMYGQNLADSVKGITNKKRQVVPEPIAVYTNRDIQDLPQTVISKKLISYKGFPGNQSTKKEINRPAELSKIGAILNTNKAGQTYVYATPVNNNIKNEVAFRINGFNPGNFLENEGLMLFNGNDATQYNGLARDKLYKNTITPGYATSYLLNAVLSPDYVDVKNDGITDDDLGGFVKFNYTKSDSDYRWRIPYADKEENLALLNQGVKVTKFDDMGSYVVGSKETWYAHSIESKNYVVEFYLSDRKDALDSRSKIMRGDHPYAVDRYKNDKDTFSHTQKLDSVKYYYKHDRYLNQATAIPLKTIYFDYDYGISSNIPNSRDTTIDSITNKNLLLGKLRLLKVRVRHGSEPIDFAETYDLGYVDFNPSYSLGAKDGWGNYYPNTRSIPLCEFPYIDQEKRSAKDTIASAFHLNSIGLPSGGRIDIEYEADDYSYVQDKRAMALTEVAGVGMSTTLLPTDVMGLYDPFRNPFLYIYVKKPAGLTGNYKSFLLNGSNLMYFSFRINIAGNAFSTFDQVKGYAEVEDIGGCSNDTGYLYIKVKPVSLTGTTVKPSPMVNTAINMARAFASDQLYFQEAEDSTGKSKNHRARLKKAANQVGDALLGKNSIGELMKDYKAAHKFIKEKSFVRLAMTKPKIGGGSRVSKLTFDDEWNKMTTGESSSLIGYKYTYKDNNGMSSGVASYEPLLGGEENPLRSGNSYALSNNPSRYPPYDPVELMKEDPAGESFFPAGAVGYSTVTIESIHKGYARSAQSKLVHEFYTAKDFPFFSTYGAKTVKEEKDDQYPTPGARDIMLGFLGISNTISSSKNSYDIRQSFVIETNDMHGKPKATYNYRLLPLPQNNKTELVNSTEYHYHTSGNRLSNEVNVIQHQTLAKNKCYVIEKNFPKANIVANKKTLGVDIDVCTDSREVVTTETREIATRGGELKVCIPPFVRPKFTWSDNTHKHVDYFKSTTTTKIVNRYGILKSVRTYNEGAETIVENKYYDAITGNAVVQVVKDKYGDNIYSTNIPAYWTKTDLEPSYIDNPFSETGIGAVLPNNLPAFNAIPAGFLPTSNLLQSYFETEHDIFHQGDEIFVKASSNVNSNPQWYRLYVVDVLVKKEHYSDPDPLYMRYGKGESTGATHKVFVTPYKVNNVNSPDLKSGDQLTNIQTVFRYKSGRKNMLDVSAGNYQSLKDPFVGTETEFLGWQGDTAQCYGPSFRKPVINATASRYEGINSVRDGNLNSYIYNPVSSGLINQPYVSATYALYGDRKDLYPTGIGVPLKQRTNGVLFNWYYWLPARYDSSDFVTRKSLLTHYDNAIYKGVTEENPNAIWFPASQVTKSIPSIGPVEEKNPLGIYNAIYVAPVTKKVMHVTANGKFGQTWVETFEDMQQIMKNNGITDFIFSPFQQVMTKSGILAPNYEVFEPIQNAFKLDKAQAHTGLYSLYVNNSTSINITPKKYADGISYSNLFDFNLNDNTDQKYTCEVWIKRNGTISNPSVIINGQTTTLTAVSNAIDGWTLYRANIKVSHNVAVSFTFPASQNYDDLRVYPSAANVKTYVYHPFKTYLMAVLDENNYATFYEYNNRNQLVRLKKETEKGVLTITENIKNTIVK